MRRVLRYIFPGGTPKSGRVVDLGEGDTVGVDVISALAADGVDFARFDVRVYDDLVGGWRRLSDDECPSPECWTTVREGELVRCEFSLELKPEPRASTSELPPFERVLDASAASTLLTPPPRRARWFLWHWNLQLQDGDEPRNALAERVSTRRELCLCHRRPLQEGGDGYREELDADTGV